MIEKFQFSNPEVAENFEPTFGIDVKITRQKVYSGLLSNITPKMAEAMVNGGSNLIKRKAINEDLSEQASA